MTEEADSNLYVNPLEAAEKCGNRVKKSASGEVGRNVGDASPSVESLKDVRPFNEGSRVTLNDTVPKHRKIRIQQVCSLFCFLIDPFPIVHLCTRIYGTSVKRCLSTEKCETALTVRNFEKNS